MRIPEGWTQPKYGLGERTKQGMIIGIDYYPKYTRAAHEYGNIWRYLVTRSPFDNPDDLIYYEESEVEPLPQDQLRAQIQDEIDFHTKRLEFLKKELLFSECNVSMIGSDVLVSCESDDIFIELVKKQHKMICKLTTGRHIDRIILISKEGNRTTFYPKK